MSMEDDFEEFEDEMYDSLEDTEDALDEAIGI